MFIIDYCPTNDPSKQIRRAAGILLCTVAGAAWAADGIGVTMMYRHADGRGTTRTELAPESFKISSEWGRPVVYTIGNTKSVKADTISHYFDATPSINIEGNNPEVVWDVETETPNVHYNSQSGDFWVKPPSGLEGKIETAAGRLPDRMISAEELSGRGKWYCGQDAQGGFVSL